MEKIDEKQIEQLLDDISQIKSVLRKNKPVLKQIFDPAQFRLIIIVYAISGTLFPLLIYLLIKHFGSFYFIPSSIRWGIYIAITINILIIAYIKFTNASLTKIRKELLSFRFIHFYLSSLFIIIVISFYLLHLGKPYYIVSSICIYMGFLFNFYGSITEIQSYLRTGYWFLLTGVFTLLVTSISPLLYLAISQGIGWSLLTLRSEES